MMQGLAATKELISKDFEPVAPMSDEDKLMISGSNFIPNSILDLLFEAQHIIGFSPWLFIICAVLQDELQCGVFCPSSADWLLNSYCGPMVDDVVSTTCHRNNPKIWIQILIGKLKSLQLFALKISCGYNFQLFISPIDGFWTEDSWGPFYFFLQKALTSWSFKIIHYEGWF